MKKMKKLLAMALIVVLSVSCMTACGGSGDKNKGGAKNIEISYWNAGMGSEWLDNVIKAFETKYPEYHVHYNASAAQESYKAAYGIFSYGDVADYYDTFGYDTSADAIIFENNEVRNTKDYSKRTVINNMGLYDRDNNVGYSVKIRVEDTQFTLDMKPLGATQWQQILSYKIGNETPNGYIHIWSASSANFAIDNFAVKNLDKDANTIEVDYKGSAIEGAEDWDYKPMKDVYLEVEDQGQSQWWMLPVLGASIGVVFVLASLLIAKRQRKEAGKNV